jgi:hypothetical protein
VYTIISPREAKETESLLQEKQDTPRMAKQRKIREGKYH